MNDDFRYNGEGTVRYISVDAYDKEQATKLCEVIGRVFPLNMPVRLAEVADGDYDCKYVVVFETIGIWLPPKSAQFATVENCRFYVGQIIKQIGGTSMKNIPPIRAVKLNNVVVAEGDVVEVSIARYINGDSFLGEGDAKVQPASSVLARVIKLNDNKMSLDASKQYLSRVISLDYNDIGFIKVLEEGYDVNSH